MHVSIDNTLTPSELRRRLPEVYLIHDTGVREQTISAFLDCCPDYFWTTPASTSGNYHHPDHREQHGLWVHTKRAFTKFCNIALAEFQKDAFTTEEIALGQAGILCHDMFKRGWDPVSPHTHDDHDMIAADILAANTNLPDEVIGCVRTHNGKWGGDNSPEPRTRLEEVHHDADYYASRKNENIAIHPGHVATELTTQFPTLWVDEDTYTYDKIQKYIRQNAYYAGWESLNSTGITPPTGHLPADD